MRSVMSSTPSPHWLSRSRVTWSSSVTAARKRSGPLMRMQSASAPQHRIGDAEPVDEAGARRRQVEGRDRPHSEPGLEETGERRKGELGRGGGDDDRVEVAGRGTGGFERGAGGGLGEVEERF